MKDYQFWLLMAVLFSIAGDIAAMPKRLSRLGLIHVAAATVAAVGCAIKALLS